MAQQAQDDFSGDGEALAVAYAGAVNEEIKDLFAAGCDVVQLDEPYMQARPEKARQYGLKALERALEGVEGTTALHKAYPGGSGNVADTMTGAEFIDALAKLPLHYQPGTRWDYSYGLDILGIALESVAKQPLGRVLQDRIFRPLRMNDTAFTVPPEKGGRIARALSVDPVTGQPQSVRDQTKPWGFECGGGCLTSTAVDYLRFAQMLLNRGALDGTRVLGRKTVEYMTADHLGPEVDASRLHNFPVEHIDGYGFGLGVAVRRVPGVAGIMGSPGDYRWSGAQGTLFWVDPKEELAVVYMAQTPGAIRAHYRQVIATLVQQAIVD
jgi:CubicO group peptidase (beta-lactamase class C family)